MLAGDREGLVVATPERVTFAYEVAGVGSRFLAQLVDLAVFIAIMVALLSVLYAVVSTTHDLNLALILWSVLSFVLIFGYFPVAEGLTHGQTLGKRVVRLRVVGDRGEPVTITQVAIRNLVRVVDFLPFAYGAGVLTMFAGARGKRLGDYAAGTVVVRERQRVGLADLLYQAKSGTAPAPPEGGLPDDNYTRAAARADPTLRRFVLAYARRRPGLATWRRQQLADQVAPALSALLPAETSYYGNLVLLDALADRIPFLAG